MLRDLQDRQESVKQLPMQSLSRNFAYNRFWILLVPLIVFILLYLNFNQFFKFDSATNKQHQPIKTPDNLPKQEIVMLSGDNKTPNIIQPQEKNPVLTLEAAKTKISPANISTTQIEKTSTNNSSKEIKSNESIQTLMTDKNTSVQKEENLEMPLEKENVVIKQQSLKTKLFKQLNSIKKEQNIYGVTQTKKSLKLLLQENPEFHSARLHLLKLMWQSNDPDIEMTFNKAIDSYPIQQSFKLTAARYFIETNKLDKALLALNHAGSAQTPESLQMRAFIYQKRNNHQVAIQDYAMILNQQPDRGDIYISLGISLEAMGRISQAKLSFEKALLDRKLSPRQVSFVRKKIQ